MRRKSSKRKPRKRSKGKGNHAYEIATPSVKLSPRPLIGLWQVRGGTVLSVLLLAALGLLIGQFFTTYRFYVYETEVQGNQFVDRDEIYDASGLHEMSIFWIKPRQVEAAIANLPGIKEVKVICWLPNRVKIEVVEGRTQIIWQRGETRYGVDDQGTILPLEGESEGLRPEAQPEGMLLIQDLTTGPLEVGDRIDPEAVRSALDLRRLLPETVVFQYSEDEGLSFHQGGCPIYLGVSDMVEKVAILDALLQDLASEGIKPQFVDLRFKESPFYRQ
ncbi:MAG: FtsQ-type POTRA domain-containing protein [Chloroflexi bacterium]|nr:FtsQ-type POTRA domain-containing protein [Chloroflexota bacterium]